MLRRAEKLGKAARAEHTDKVPESAIQLNPLAEKVASMRVMLAKFLEQAGNSNNITPVVSDMDVQSTSKPHPNEGRKSLVDEWSP